MTRPKYPKPDANNSIVPDALRELTGAFMTVDPPRLRYWGVVRGQMVVILKIADLPFQIDWLVFGTDWFFGVEVKQPGKEEALTEGEMQWIDLGLPVLIATDVEAVKAAIERKLSKAV